MSITDELRKFANDRIFMGNGYMELTAITDRIDAEYQKAIRELNNLADSSVLLPVDADGVPIHLGDEVYQVEGGWVYTVKSITFYPDNTTISFECKHGFGCDNAHRFRHYHAPTVENLLMEFAQRLDEPMRYDRDEMVEQYAAKLRLADDEKEQ